MTFQFRPNPNLKSALNQMVRETLERCSDFSITDSLHALFVCDGKVVLVSFVNEGKQVGEKFSFPIAEAANLGQQIMNSGTWDEFPVSGISVDGLKAFGQRLRDYGLNGC